jgi:flagellar basal-body rod protein FlgC
MSFFRSMDISASALTAQSFRMDVIAQNIANVDTTRTADGTPYQRKTVILGQAQPTFADLLAEAGNPAVRARGVEVTATVVDTSAGRLAYDPDHPDANAEGYVQMPNVDITTEYVDMISASRSYEANLTVISATKRMAVKALEISR